jgi:hypothetical protein
MSDTKSVKALEEARTHLAVALEHHAAGRHSAVKRRIELARSAIDDVLDAHSAANPTAEMGAQVSDGQSPRTFTPEQIRQRDQLAGCRAGYEARMRGRLR